MIIPINNCRNKMSFDTKAEAENAVRVTEYQRGTKLKVYSCRYCQLWHMASDYGEKNDD